MKELKDQIKEFKSLMSESWDKGMEGEDKMIDKFYNSEFTISFEDNVTNKTAKIKLFICPEVWELFEDLCNDLEENLEDYE